MTAGEIGRRIDGLGLWEAVAPYHWAIKPRGTVLPYFVCVLKGERSPVKARLLLLEGWQTFHDFVRTRVDRNFGWYSSPVEFAHFELVVLENGESKIFRHDPGYVPAEASGHQLDLCARMLWEVFGVMMRIESDRKLPLAYSAEKAVFARVEGEDGAWRDEPLAIPDPRPHVESVSSAARDVKLAKDMPFAKEESLELDFRLMPGLMTRESRPRSGYLLAAVDGASGECVIRDRLSATPEGGLRALWEGIPPRVLAHIVSRGRVPGEIKVVSGRVFRMIRPLCAELPFRLSLHDALPRLEAVFARG